MDPIIIIGTGLAGYTLAKEFRKLDMATPLTIITSKSGRFYSKPLLSTALAKRQQPSDLAIATADKMALQLNAEILTKTRVTKIDPQSQTIYTHDKNLPYSKLILACGADPIRPPLEGDAADDVLSVNDLEDYAVFRDALLGKKHITIIGAGLVGCEFANDLLNAGYQVSVVAQSEYPLDSFLPEVIGREFEFALASQGAKWYLEQTVDYVDKQADGFRVTLSDKSTLYTDVVLSAIGLRPHTKLAKTANLEIRRGIVVDRTLQTSSENIYALGDCAEVNGMVQLFVSPLLECARTLAKTLTGDITYINYPPMPIVVKTPAFPLVILPPPPGVPGEWKVTGENHDYTALFYANSQMLGFVLTGNCVRDKASLVSKFA